MAIEKGGTTLLPGTVLFALVLLAVGCAPIQPTNPAGPRGNEPAYPVVLAEDANRRESARAAFLRLRQSGASGRGLTTSENNPTDLNLSPITATIQSLPSNGAGGVYLPKVGVEAVMNEEETRESLRRFLKEWREIIGAEPARLSLVDHTVQPDGSSVANYDQRAFRFPIRGNYGKLQIRFAADRRVLSIFSSCVPDAEKLRSALRVLSGGGGAGGVNARLTAEEATKKLRESEILATTPTPSTFKLPATAQVSPTELVTHVRPSKTADTLEFRVAWEMSISNGPIKLAYVDALTGEVIAVE